MEDEYHTREYYKSNPNRPRIWTSEETDRLVQIWSQHETLYNPRHPDYYKRDKRQIAISDICKDLGDISSLDITRKMENLRSYFGREKKRIIMMQERGSYDVKSKWAYFDSLMFLDKHMNQKKPTTRLDDDNVLIEPNQVGQDMVDGSVDNQIRTEQPVSVYRVQNEQFPSHIMNVKCGDKRKLDEAIAKLQKPQEPIPSKMASTFEQRSAFPEVHRKNDGDSVVLQEARIYSSPSASFYTTERKLSDLNDDMIFAEHIGRTISSIDDELLKEDLKLQIQQCICSAKRKQIAIQREQRNLLQNQHKNSPNKPMQWKNDAQETMITSHASLSLESENSPANSQEEQNLPEGLQLNNGTSC